MNGVQTDQRSSLLDQLRIDRDDDEGRGPFWSWFAGIAVLAVGVALAAWFLLTIPPTVLIDVATAELVSHEVDLGRGSALDGSGYVVARRQATVSSKITGKVMEVLIEEGQRVDVNEIIARLDDTNARAQVAQAAAQRDQAAASLTAARVAFDNAGPTFARHKDQLARAIISAQEFDTAKASYDALRTNLEVAARAVAVADANLAMAQRNLDDTVVRAPFAGVVTVKAAQEGEMVSPVSAGGGFTRTGIGTIVDMESLEVEVDVSENFINRVRPGQEVAVKLNAYPEWEIAARVAAIIPTADRAKATVKVRVALDARDVRILPEMGVRVSFFDDRNGNAGAAHSAVIVPPSAVQASGDTGVVFVINDTTVERRTVRLGGRSAEGQVVVSGLSSGARLAVADFSQLSDGARVRITQ